MNLDDTFYQDEEIAFGLKQTEHGKKPLMIYPEACGIIALEYIDAEAHVYMVEQFRLGANVRSLEIPAGKKKPKETKEQCAHRELEEETGIRAQHLELLISYYPAIGISTEILHIFLAKGLSRGNLNPDDDEDIVIEKVSFKKLFEILNRQEIKDSKTILSLLLLKNKKIQNYS